MSRAAVSMLVFGVYAVMVGLMLLVIPNVVLGLLAYPTTSEVWIRILGFVATALGYYYIVAARYELVPLFRASVHGRVALFVCYVCLVVLGMAKPILVLFGGVDLLGAIWTGWALRSSQQSR